ncbi:hypothetical protein Q4I30_004770 [Leishmania utingensis]|uniref:Uncharacterized protein n=1 Tax=Leishmania utingensis TaxID=653362 RepID=A0AAW3ABT9_9TRYP
MLNITSIGAVVQSSTYCGAMFGKPIIYPDGYTIERAVFAPAQAAAQAPKPTFTYKAPFTTSAAAMKDELYFTATIRWVKGYPTFTIARSDNPAEKIYTDIKSATTAWRKALEDAVKDFPGRQADLPVLSDSKSKLQVNGIRLYCLHLKDVHDELVALPGGQAAFDAAAAAAAAPASSAVAADAAELDTRSTSLLSAPGSQSQSQSKARGHRAVSPVPKSYAKGPTEAPSSAHSSKKRATPSRRASVDKDASSTASTASLSVTATIGSQPLKNGVAIGPAKRRQMPKLKGLQAAVTTESTAVTSGETAASMDSLSVKRRRTPSNKRDPETKLAPAAVVVVCPDCGLGGTPFCATTGKPHLPPPCIKCGLTTAFCPATGQPHSGAVQRENRQRGEVHLPGAARKPWRRVSKQPLGAHAAAGTGGEVTAGTMIATQDGDGSAVDAGEGAGADKKPRRKRLRAEGGSRQRSSGGADVSTDGTKEKRARASRSRKAKDRALVSAPSTDPLAKGIEAIKGDAIAASVVVDAPPPVEVLVHTYPPLRPPLTLREHHKAAHLLQESWKAQYGDGPVLPAAVGAVPLALVPAKRVAAAGANRRRRGRGGGAASDGASGEEVRQSDDGEGGEGKETRVARVKSGGYDDGDANSGTDTTKSGVCSTVGSPTSTTATAPAIPTMVHPLEVTQLATSVVGKRLSRFLLQYTSERTLFDLLKSSSAAADGGAGKKTPKQPVQQTSAGGETGAGGEGNGEHAVDVSGASPREESQESVTHEVDGIDGAVPPG